MCVAIEFLVVGSYFMVGNLICCDWSLPPDSALAFKKRMKLGQFADRSVAAAKVAEEVAGKEKELADSISVGARCEVTVADSEPKRGTVMFVGVCVCKRERERERDTFSFSSGLTKFKPGYWVGVKYDEPVGKNDGRLVPHKNLSHSHFSCPTATVYLVRGTLSARGCMVPL